jgi:hypothetical protein
VKFYPMILSVVSEASFIGCFLAQLLACMKSLIPVFAQTVAASFYSRKLWIWGPDVPTNLASSYGRTGLYETYPDHGFIQLGLTLDEVFIDLVKRPPAQYFDPTEKFCTALLPAAITDLLEGTSTNIAAIQAINVVVDAEPYSAACKCYMRT